MLNFNNFFEFEKDQIQDPELLARLNKIVITPELTKLIEENSGDSTLGVINGILCVESNGKINRDNISKAKRKDQKFGKDKLKGLYKVYISLPGIQNLAAQLKLKSKIGEDSIEENDLFTLLEDLITLQKTPEKLRTKRENNWNTGCWLIYGIDDDTTHYLWMDTGTEHDPDIIDEKIYEQLNAHYSTEYLSKFIRDLAPTN